MIPVPFWLFVGLVAVGVIFWIIDQPAKARRREARRESDRRLSADLQAPKRSTNLPYGFSNPSDTQHEE